MKRKCWLKSQTAWGTEWEQKGTHEEHLMFYTSRKERKKEVASVTGTESEI